MDLFCDCCKKKLADQEHHIIPYWFNPEGYKDGETILLCRSCHLSVDQFFANFVLNRLDKKASGPAHAFYTKKYIRRKNIACFYLGFKRLVYTEIFVNLRTGSFALSNVYRFWGEKNSCKVMLTTKI